MALHSSTNLADAVISWPLAVAIIGMLLWVIFTPAPRRPIAAEAGRLAYFAGLLVLLFTLANVALRLA
jgi:hypothetical protein